MGHWRRSFEWRSDQRRPEPAGRSLSGNGVACALRYRVGETLLEYPATIGIGSSESIILERTEGRTDEANFFVANDAGTLVWQAQSSESHRRLVSIDNGQLSMLASFGGNDQTPASAGGAFAGVYQIFSTASMIAVDDGGRVMVSAEVADGPDGLYVYENGQWQRAALFGQIGVGGETVSCAESLRTAGGSFYVQFCGGNVLAEYINQQWVSMVRTGDTLPSGLEITGMTSGFEVNRRGDIAVGVGTRGGRVVVLRTADGAKQTVCENGELTEQGDRFWPRQNFGLDLRDGRTFYFIGIELWDRNVFYRADPLF